MLASAVIHVSITCEPRSTQDGFTSRLKIVTPRKRHGIYNENNGPSTAQSVSQSRPFPSHLRSLSSHFIASQGKREKSVLVAQTRGGQDEFPGACLGWWTSTLLLHGRCRGPGRSACRACETTGLLLSRFFLFSSFLSQFNCFTGQTAV